MLSNTIQPSYGARMYSTPTKARETKQAGTQAMVIKLSLIYKYWVAEMFMCFRQYTKTSNLFALHYLVDLLNLMTLGTQTSIFLDMAAQTSRSKTDTLTTSIGGITGMAAIRFLPPPQNPSLPP